MSATQRTICALREEGYSRVQVVENYHAFSKRRQDLFGFIDVLAIRPGRILGVQVTTASNHASRRSKILGERRGEAMDWLAAGCEIEVWSWRLVAKRRKDGSKSLRKEWRWRREPIGLSDLEASDE